MMSSTDAGYGVGLSKGATEPFPEFTWLDEQMLNKYSIAIENAHENNWTQDTHGHAAHARTEAWLDQIQVPVPFDEILFFVAFDVVRDNDLKSFAMLNSNTIFYENLISTSIVFCLPDGEILYDRAAVLAFIEHASNEVMYWGPEIKDMPLAATLTDPLYPLPSSTNTKHDEAESFLDETQILEDTLSDASENADDHETESEASFCCFTAVVHDQSLGNEKKQRPRILQSDILPFRRPFYSPPAKYINKKKSPPKPLWTSKTDNSTPSTPIVRRPKSFQRPPPRKDKTAAIRAMRTNIRNASLSWPKDPQNFADIQFLPPPRLHAKPPRPNASIIQPVHPDVKAQRETAKPLYLTVVQRGPDALPTRHFPYENSPDALRSLDLLRVPSATATTNSSAASSEGRFLHADLVPAPLRINAKGIWPRPASCTVRCSVDLGIRAQWEHIGVQQPCDDGCHGGQRQGSGVDVQKEKKARDLFALKPFRFLRRLVNAATKERDWIF